MRKFKNLVLFLVFLMFATIVLPHNVFATSGFDKMLTDGKLVVPSIAPTNFEEYYDYISNYLMNMDNVEVAYPSNANSDFTKCDITIEYKDGTSEEKQNVTVEYAGGSKSIKTKIDAFKSKIPSHKTFAVRDMEVINYLVNGSKAISVEETRDIMANYSGELKKVLNNSNISISFKTATGMGDEGTLFEAHLGDAILSYDGIGYAMVGPVGAKVEYVIYVEDGTTDLMKAAQERIDNYIGKGKVTLSEGDLIETLYSDPADMEFEFGEDGLNIDSSKVEDYYVLSLPDGLQRPIIIIADSSKMVEPTYLSTDLETDVSISSANKTIPLDTRIKSTQLTSGTEYENIIKVLNVEENETYDLSLYSDSLSKNITKLDNGTFEVKIPVNDNLKNKDLTAYYVDGNDEVIEYDVKIKDGYAIFTTNHFSIYTLAEKQVEEEITTETPSTETTTSTQTAEKDETPKTGTADVISYVLIVTFISLVGIVILRKKI